ncbi:MAG: hypothetical protein JSV96_00350 [Candidatus Aminicenantes bacterium]|nr:MAG: hypothetical protein JSV96_00350 [Candidatus Aminicenantes bacterium]
MIRKVLFLLTFVLSLNFYSFGEEASTLDIDIGLIEGKTGKAIAPPKKLMIGIEIPVEAYYKLSDKENVIKGGFLRRGLNMVDIEARGLFEESGTHVYFLDLKVGDLIFKKEIEIDIHLDSRGWVDSGTPSQVGETGYELSMFVGNQLIVTGKKVPFRGASFEIEKPPLPEGYGPFYEIEKEFKNPMLNSFSVIDAAGVVFDLIKKAIGKKKRQKSVSPFKKYTHLTVTFLRRDSEGVSTEINARIELKAVKDVS